MDKIRIFCEGYADQRLLRDFLYLHYGIVISDEELKTNKIIHKLDSWKSLELQKTIITNEFSDYTSLIFLDADDEKTIGKAGILETNQFIDKLIESWNWENYDKYVFPNNENYNGEVEDLLENIINKNNKNIFECWNKYENCIKTYNIYKSPAKKSKIFAYKECLNNLGKYNFKDENLWDLKDLTNPYLLRLKDFFDKYIK